MQVIKRKEECEDAITCVCKMSLMYTVYMYIYSIYVESKSSCALGDDVCIFVIIFVDPNPGRTYNREDC